MKIVQRVDTVGRREATTIADSTVQEVFSTVSGDALVEREFVSVCNASASKIYVRLVDTGAAAPTISTTNHDYFVAPYSTSAFPVSQNIAVFLWQNSGGALNFTAWEGR